MSASVGCASLSTTSAEAGPAVLCSVSATRISFHNKGAGATGHLAHYAAGKGARPDGLAAAGEVVSGTRGMLPTVTLHLHRADRTDVLADGLAGLLQVPLEDPFAEEVVVVPAKG